MRRAVCAALVIALCVRTALADETPPPSAVDLVHGFRVERKPRIALAITGAALFAGGYLGAVLVALIEGLQGVSPLVLVPLAGPWIGIGWDAAHPNSCPLDVNATDCASSSPDLALGIAGGLQVVGATMFGVGMVRHDVKKTITVTPTFSLVGRPFIGIRGVF